MPDTQAFDPKVGDTVRVVYGVTPLDAFVIDVEGDQITMKLIWNDPTMPEEDIEPTFITYPRELVEPKE